MKRHSGLVPLSHDHHHELAEARRLLRAAGADDAALRVAAADRYVRVFFGETVEHFRKEEELLFPLYVHHAGRTAALERVLHEHMQLHGLVRALRSEAAGGDVPRERLQELGDLLHQHVRFEERKLFEEIQRAVPAEELEALNLPTSTAGACEA